MLTLVAKQKKMFLGVVVLVVVLAVFSCSKGSHETDDKTVTEQQVKEEPSFSRFKPTAHFLYSLDGNSYRESVADIVVGQQFWLRVEVSVQVWLWRTLWPGASREGSLNWIPVSVSIPNTEILDFSLKESPIGVTPVEDTINNIRTYNFRVLATSNAEKTPFILRCRALSAGLQRITITYGPQIHSEHAKFHVVTYVDAE